MAWYDYILDYSEMTQHINLAPTALVLLYIYTICMYVYCRGQAKPGETVLIHGASGGVRKYTKHI